ncbi:MAG: hypothetical protein LW807_05810 [Proteobacteria bacterium]|jgi:hypothetical protein|nr:hypothetical protein [Pseudomonadota bacterium]
MAIKEIKGQNKEKYTKKHISDNRFILLSIAGILDKSVGYFSYMISGNRRIIEKPRNKE